MGAEGCVARLLRACPAAPLASIRHMIRQVSRGSAGEYQADEQAGVALPAKGGLCLTGGISVEGPHFSATEFPKPPPHVSG